jgi:hypothetical protein
MMKQIELKNQFANIYLFIDFFSLCGCYDKKKLCSF